MSVARRRCVDVDVRLTDWPRWIVGESWLQAEVDWRLVCVGAAYGFGWPRLDGFTNLRPHRVPSNAYGTEPWPSSIPRHLTTFIALRRWSD